MEVTKNTTTRDVDTEGSKPFCYFWSPWDNEKPRNYQELELLAACGNHNWVVCIAIKSKLDHCEKWQFCEQNAVEIQQIKVNNINRLLLPTTSCFIDLRTTSASKGSLRPKAEGDNSSTLALYAP